MNPEQYSGIYHTDYQPQEEENMPLPDTETLIKIVDIALNTLNPNEEVKTILEDSKKQLQDKQSYNT